jgi:hypothetical protein
MFAAGARKEYTALLWHRHALAPPKKGVGHTGQADTKTAFGKA